MASSAENTAVNLAGFPPFLPPLIFTTLLYGAMFVPQVLTAIATSLLAGSGAPLQRQAVLLLGLGSEHHVDGPAGRVSRFPTTQLRTHCYWWPPRSSAPASA